MKEIFQIGTTAYLPGSSTVVTEIDSRALTIDGDYPTSDVKPASGSEAPKTEAVKFVKWGRNDKLPLEVMDKVYKNVTTSANVDFNTRLSAGEGVIVYKKVRQGNKIVPQVLLDTEAPAVFDFLAKVGYGRIVQEVAADLSVFADSMVEISISKEGRKVADLEHKEMCYSRLSETNDQGEIEWHGYCATWHKSTDDVIVTPFLDRRKPYIDILRRLGIEPGKTGERKDSSKRRFVMSMSTPVPGRFYYNKPYWWSIFEAGWYDFACSIPEFKRALIKNQMVVKWHVHIESKFWDKLYKAAGATSEEDKERIKKGFLEYLDKFLAGNENAGKSFVSEFRYDHAKGLPLDDIRITAVDNGLKGGEYISDSEEVANIICYAMGVHPSLIGASPGKNGTISGSEARELFIIKQALLKPIRDMITLPLYIAKKLNGWDADIHFAVPNIELTTLDRGTGSQKNIGNEAV